MKFRSKANPFSFAPALLVCWVLCFYGVFAGAEDNPPEGPANEEESASPTWEQRFLETNIYLSDWFDGMAEGLDLFLVGKQITKKRNETSVTIENSSYYLQGQSFNNTSNINANLRLPNLEEYWQLKFTSYDQNQEHGIQQTYLRQTPRERNYGASVGLFRKLGNVRVSFQPRISLQNPIKISHSLSFESFADLKTYQFNPKIQFFADPDKGAGIFQSYDLVYHLSKIWSVTLITEGEYDDRIHLFSVSNGFSFGEMVSSMSSLGYSLIFSSTNQPSYELAGYSFAVTWAHMLYKNILDYQIIPHWDFSMATGYEGKYGLTVNINLNF